MRKNAKGAKRGFIDKISTRQPIFNKRHRILLWNSTAIRTQSVDRTRALCVIEDYVIKLLHAETAIIGGRKE